MTEGSVGGKGRKTSVKQEKVDTPAVPIHLARIAPPIPVTDKLQQWDRNLAGQSLLPGLPRFD